MRKNLITELVEHQYLGNKRLGRLIDIYGCDLYYDVLRWIDGGLRQLSPDNVMKIFMAGNDEEDFEAIVDGLLTYNYPIDDKLGNYIAESFYNTPPEDMDDRIRNILDPWEKVREDIPSKVFKPLFKYFDKDLGNSRAADFVGIFIAELEDINDRRKNQYYDDDMDEDSPIEYLDPYQLLEEAGIGRYGN